MILFDKVSLEVRIIYKRSPGRFMAENSIDEEIKNIRESIEGKIMLEAFVGLLRRYKPLIRAIKYSFHFQVLHRSPFSLWRPLPILYDGCKLLIRYKKSWYPATL